MGLPSCPRRWGSENLRLYTITGRKKGTLVALCQSVSEQNLDVDPDYDTLNVDFEWGDSQEVEIIGIPGWFLLFTRIRV